MVDSDPSERPSWACVTHRPPPAGREHVKADDGYKTCSPCLDRIREDLRDVARRYVLLDPRPGASGEHGTRGAPGFGSRSPGSVHVMAMRDRRSSRVARTWLGRDGRLHQESERPPLSVHGVLDTLAWDVAEARGIEGPHDRADVCELTRWLDAQLDWATRQDSAAELARALRELLAQLRPVTGDPGRRYVGHCPSTIDDGEATRECGTRLYAPTNGDTIQCTACDREWPRAEWLRLGDLLGEAA